MTTPVALTIAGSDSSGGAGIQADLKTFAALGVYGASAITALTAQNTTGVTGIHVVPANCWIDPSRAVDNALVTHGHADHARGGHRRTIATAETLAIMELRYQTREGALAVSYGESITLPGGVSATFVPVCPVTLLKFACAITPATSVGSIAVGVPPKLPPTKFTPMNGAGAADAIPPAANITAPANTARALKVIFFSTSNCPVRCEHV